MPLTRNAVTFAFCQTSRSSRRTTAIFVSNCIGAYASEAMDLREAVEQEAEAARAAVGSLRDDAVAEALRAAAAILRERRPEALAANAADVAAAGSSRGRARRSHARARGGGRRPLCT